MLNLYKAHSKRIIMGDSIITGLVQNVAILLSFSILYDIIWLKKDLARSKYGKIAVGLVIGITGILLMVTPWKYVPGITFDTRSILLLVSGMFFGTIPTLVGMLLTAIFRIFLGGAGMWMGIGTIIVSGGIGIIWHHYRYKKILQNFFKETFTAAIIAHSLMLLCILLLPRPLWLPTFNQIAIYFATLYPIGTILLGMVMLNRYQNQKTREKVKFNESIYFSFINSNTDMVVMKDENRRIILANDAFCNKFKFSYKEIIGKRDDEGLFSDDTLKLIREIDSLVVNLNTTVNKEFRFNNYIFDVKAFPIKLLDDHSGIGVIVRDITDKNKKNNLQKALLEISKISYQDLDLRAFLKEIHCNISSVINAQNFYIALYDKKTDKYSFPYYIDEMDDYESDELITLKDSLTDLVRKTGKGLMATAETEDQIRKENNLVTYGEYSPIWLGAPIMDSALKEVIGVIAIQDYHSIDAYSYDDLTLLELFANNIGLYIERFENVNRLKVSKEKAEESDRLKTAFLANISHEIRTPMNGIVGFANILKEEIKDEELNSYVEIICKSSDRLLATINDVIDVAKIEAGQVEVHNEIFDLNVLLQDLYSFYNPQKRAFDLILSIPSKLPKKVYTDKTKLTQILNNLISNAMKFTKSGEVSFGYFDEPNSITIFVRDTGIGIPQESQNTIFERFSQVETGLKREFEGTGLGLSIAKVYTELLGGKIWLKSQVGKGTEFFLQLPMESLDSPSDKEPKENERTQKSEDTMNTTILIAEDDQNNFYYLKVILKDNSRILIHAKNGKEAVNLAKEHPEIDIILMDIKMPEMDGLEATRQIREFNPTIPIIAQTAYALTSDRERVLQSGCTDYISKPIKKEDLINLINKYLLK